MVQQLPAVDEILEYLGLGPEPTLVMGHGGADQPDRPTVTVTWAQSLDGSIAERRGVSSRLSGDASMFLTHRLRAIHDSILVGIGTVLADTPRLTTRLCDGNDPVPVILDSHLRCPPDAPFFERTSSPPVIVWSGLSDDGEGRTGGSADGVAERRISLETRGARLVEADLSDLPGLMTVLASLGLTSVMVEGGGQVIGSFLDAQIVDRLIVTVAPRMLGGYGYVNSLRVDRLNTMELSRSRWWDLGGDAVIVGRPRWR